MGRPVFADADRVVGEYEDRRQLHERRKADRRLHVVAENQEAGPISADLGQRQAVHDRAHGVLAHAKVQVAPAGVIRLQVARTLETQVRLGRGRQIGGAADQPGIALRDRIQHLGRAVPAGNTLLVGREARQTGVPAIGQLTALHALEPVRELGMGAAVVLEAREPGFAQLATAPADAGLEVLVHPVRDQELRILGPPVALLGEADLVVAERLAVRGAGVLLVRRAIADVAVDDDQGRAIAGPAEDLDRMRNPLDIVGIADAHHVPAVAHEAGRDILGERDVGVPLDRDAVAVVDPAEVRELEMAGDRCRLARHTLHHVAVAAEREDVVVEHGEVRPIEMAREPARRDRHADAVAAALTERPGRGLDARGPVILRMAGALAVELAEVPDVVERHRGLAEALVVGIDRPHAGQMQHRVEQHRGVPDREHEAVAVRPDRILGVEAQKALPERVDDRRHRHRRAGMARFRLLHRVHRQGADRVDAEIVDRGRGRHSWPSPQTGVCPNPRRRAGSRHASIAARHRKRRDCQ